MGGRCEQQCVVGFGHAQHVVTNTIFFRRDCRAVVAQEVREIRKAVIGSCKVLFGKVIVTGSLRKNVTIREVTGCNSNLGVLLDVAAEVPFSTAIEVPGARPGDVCVTLQAFVEGEQEEPIRVAPTGGIKGIDETSVIFICVKVTRTGDCDDATGSEETEMSLPSASSTFSHVSKRSDVSPVSHVSKRSDATPVSDVSGLSDESSSASQPSESDDSSGSESSGSSSSDESDSSESESGSGSAYLSAVKGCPKARSTGVFPGAGGAIPAPQLGSAPGSFIGPTGIFAGIHS